MKLFFSFVLAVSALSNCDAQIRLKGYKCKFAEVAFTTVELCCKKDTFRSTPFARDISDEVWGHEDTYETKLKAGLELCFEGDHYHKTKDSLYISTEINDFGVYYYLIYAPDLETSFSVRSRHNDPSFHKQSEWLLSQIRIHRHDKFIYFENEKRQTCESWDFPNL